MNWDLKALSWVILTVNRTIKQVLPTPEFPIVKTFSIVELSWLYNGFGVLDGSILVLVAARFKRACG
jgi:hypothetical protein